MVNTGETHEGGGTQSQREQISLNTPGQPPKVRER